jgi:hypothetical protein
MEGQERILLAYAITVDYHVELMTRLLHVSARMNDMNKKKCTYARAL